MAKIIIQDKVQLALQKSIGWIMAITGAIGTFASLMLSIAEFHHLKQPAQALNCDLNPLIGCGSILDTWQGHVLLGVPNQFFGLMAFVAFTTLGVLLLSGIRFPKWIWQGLQVGVLGGVVFVMWFMFQSLFVLNHLCPYCMVTWVVVLIAAWYITVYNLSEKHILLPASLRRTGESVVRHHAEILITIFVVIILGILFRFRAFFFGI